MVRRQKNKFEAPKQSVRKRLTDTLDISTELMNECVLVKMCGDSEIMIENYKGIIDYSDKNICIKSKPHNLKIIGESLEIKTLTDEILYITGSISEVCYINYEKNN